MKLFKTLSLLGVGLVAMTMAAAQGCSSDDSGSSGGPSSGTGTVPPGPPAGAAASDTPARTFAINKLFLGETTRENAAKPDAWKDYGYNIDGLITTKTDTNVCTRAAGADSSKQEDGNGGIDNSFGRTVLGFITTLLPTPSKTLNDSIASGAFTIMLDIKGLSDDPAQNAIGLGGRLLVGGNYGEGKTPSFAPTDSWPYNENPIVPINGAYINNGTFVNGAGGATVQLSLLISGQTLSLTINKAVITFKHAPPNDITNGTISGVIDTEALVSGIEKVAGRISPTLCGGATLETVKQTIRQASDIKGDGTNGPGACNAISIGLGFTGKRIGPPTTIAAPVPATPDPCTATPDAGADSSTPTDSGTDSGDAGDGG
ncbi:MAG: hypothetical protein JWP97_4821 [Labilithrix sp.]|nr:hypothetical protein [Labilithrix sp.]